MPTLSFDSETHTYTLDGEVIPSVTQIIDAVTGKDFSKINPDVLRAAAGHGTLIHLDVSTKNYQTPEGKWIRDELADAKIKNEVVGYTIVDGFAFAGTADILNATEKSIDDIKTQSAKDLLSWTIQLNLYSLIFPGANQLRVFHTPKTGNYTIVPIALLAPEKNKEIINAYREGRTLDNSFLSAIERPESSSLDLVVSKYTVGELTTNAKEILATVKKNLANYKAENYSETNIADAKRDKAELNAAAKKLNDKRIELEREFNKPFEEFKATIAETCAAIKTASAQIDAVVREVDERERNEKRLLIEQFFAGLHCEYFALEQIFNAQWLNKGAKMKDIQAEILARMQKTKDDLVILDRINEPEAKAYYLQTLDLDSALRKADEIKASRERLAAIEKASAAEPKPTPTPEPEPEIPMDIPVELQEAVSQEPKKPELLERTMWVRGTYEQIVALSNWMNTNGIEFRKL